MDEEYEQDLAKIHRRITELDESEVEIGDLVGLFLTYQQLSIECVINKDYSKSEQYKRWMLEIGELLSTRRDGQDVLPLAKIAFDSAARTDEGEKNFLGAEENYRKALSIQEQLFKGTKESDNRIELREYAESYYHLGEVLRKQGKFFEAEKCYNTAIDLLNQYPSPYEDATEKAVIYLLFVDIYEGLGDTLRAMKKVRKAKSNYMSANKLLTELEGIKDSVYELIDIQISDIIQTRRYDNYKHLGIISRIEGDVKKTNEYFAEVIKYDLEKEKEADKYLRLSYIVPSGIVAAVSIFWACVKKCWFAVFGLPTEGAHVKK